MNSSSLRIQSLITIVLITTLILGGIGSLGLADEKIRFVHDNPEYQENWLKIGNLAADTIGVNSEITPFNLSVYKSRVKSDLTTGRAPEIFKWWFGYRARELVKAGLVADLSEVWKEAGSHVAEGIQEQLTINGTTYGVPFQSSYWIWFYNKNVLEKYDLTPPQTWKGFMDQAQFLHEKGVDVIGNTIGESRWTSFIVFQELMIRQSYKFYNELTAGKAHWTDEPVVKTVKLWVKMLKKGYFAPMDATYVEDLPRLFQQNKLAYAPFGTWYSGILMDSGLKPGEDYGITILPPITPKGKGSVAVEISPLMVGKNSDVESAKKWLKWWISDKEARTLQYELWDGMPWTNLVSRDKVAKGHPEFASVMEQIKQYPHKVIRFWEATPSDIVEEANIQFEKILANPNKWKGALKAIEKKAAEVWADYGVDYKAQLELEN
ncbi:MAG: ABC transporter substrate-binding protein [Candidatus Bipolaricaulia bacterium]